MTTFSSAQNHGWHDVSDEVQGNYMTKLEVKFDGAGDDNHGNAGLRASINVPVTLEF